MAESGEDASALSEIGPSGVIATMGEVSDASSEVLGDPGSWLSENVAVVCDVARRVAAHRGLRQNSSAALAAGLLARLVEDDYRVLRHYKGMATITTYLTVVTIRLLLEQRQASAGQPGPVPLVPQTLKPQRPR